MPGFFLFTVIFVLLVLKEQTFAVLSLALLGLGVALTGFFPTEYGLYFTTVLMSIGFHYFEAIKQSLSLQWLSKEEAPQVLGRLIAVGAMTSLIVYGVLWALLEVFAFSFLWNFALAGGLCCALAAVMWLGFPTSPQKLHNIRPWCCDGVTGFITCSRFCPVPGVRFSWFSQHF